MLTTVILAAGKGTRMKSSLPKVLHPIAGKSLVEHVINTAKKVSNCAINLVVGHGADEVKQRISTVDNINIIVQGQQLGTGHAVQQALPYLDDNSIVLILYGDVPLIEESTIKRLINVVDQKSVGLLTVNLLDSNGYGRVIRNAADQVIAIVEQKDASEKELTIKEVNTGVMAVNAAHLKEWLPQLSNNNTQSEYYLTDIIALAKSQGIAINTEQPDHEWEVLGVNDRRQQAELERIFQLNFAEKLLINGVTLIDPSRFDCRGELIVGNDVIIDVNCIFKGNVSIGDNVKIGANCIIEDSTIASGTVIKDHCILEGATLYKNCIVGPFARLRPDTILSEHVKIGNFVETKKVNIGKGSKVNHLSYVGDATLGETVNVGAGTITCNYDGVNKHQTIIGDDVFVGSNTALIAPITIESGATIGAGSTINRVVEKDTLALTRAPQKTYREWTRPIKIDKKPS
jgi:bifunctional UDP-N-acetylglucosamine pyrophosphorylase/glucosamine-1-phosphate N-acetyltransferase